MSSLSYSEIGITGSNISYNSKRNFKKWICAHFLKIILHNGTCYTVWEIAKAFTFSAITTITTFLLHHQHCRHHHHHHHHQDFHLPLPALLMNLLFLLLLSLLLLLHLTSYGLTDDNVHCYVMKVS
jgi:hypothetical protein